MKNICYIIGAGDCFGIHINKAEGDFLIAADGGYAELKRLGIAPDLAVGDFDSLGFAPTDVEVEQHPAEKDDTDTMLAISKGIERGFKDFIIYGGLGGRLDHSLANLQALCYIAKNGCRGWLWGDGVVLTAIHNGAARFPGKCEGMVSVFAQGDAAKGVYESGLKYKLNDHELRYDNPLGTSNEFLGVASEISVRQGTLAIYWNSTAQELLEMVREGYC